MIKNPSFISIGSTVNNPIVGKSHDVLRHAKNMDCGQLYVSRDRLDRSGMCCKQLDYIDGNVTRYDSERLVPERLVTKVNMLNTVDSDTRSEVLPIRQNEATQNDSSPSRNRNGPQSHGSRARRFRQMLDQQSGGDRM